MSQALACRPLSLTDLNPALNITHVTDRVGLEAVEDFLARATEFGMDSETNIVDFFYHRRIRTVQVGNREEQYVIDFWELAGRDADLLIAAQGNYGKRLADCPLIARAVDVLRPGLETNRTLKVGHNLRFDYETMKWCFGLRPWNLYDTLLAEKLLHAGLVDFFARDFWGLDDLVARYIGVSIDKSKQKSFTLDSPLTDDHLVYAALDTRLTLGIKKKQLLHINANGLDRALRIENDALPAFGDMRLNGMLIDEQKWLALVEKFEAQHRENVKELDKYFVPVCGSKQHRPAFNLTAMEQEWRACKEREKRAELRKKFYHARKLVKEYDERVAECEGEALINYGSQSQLLDALRQMGFSETKLRDTNDRTLKKLRKEPVIQAIRNYRETGKVLSTYGRQFLKDYVMPETGRVHSEIDQYGAATGRTSSRNPNVQNIKRDSEWRNCFVAPPGWKILTIDYNGCELRILAELSQEPVWIEAFKNGWDVHSVGAEILFGSRWKEAACKGGEVITKNGKEKVLPPCAYYANHQKCECPGHKKLRDQIKAINFGLAYGMEARKLSEELEITLDEASSLMDTYKGQFVVVTAYLNNSGKLAAMKRESRTMSGRRRRYHEPTWKAAEKAALDKLKKWGRPGETLERKHINSAYKGLWAAIEREGKNTPIQGTNADIAKLAMGCGFDPNGKPYLWHILEPQFEARQINFVHDEFVIASRAEVAEACYTAATDCMERAGAEFVKSIPMTTEGHIGDCWTK